MFQDLGLDKLCISNDVCKKEVWHVICIIKSTVIWMEVRDAGSWTSVSIVWWSKPDTCWCNLCTAFIELQLINLFGNFEKRIIQLNLIIIKRLPATSLCLL